MAELIDRLDAINSLHNEIVRRRVYGEEPIDEFDTESILRSLPPVQPEKEIPKRVLWSGWKGMRDTRYKCPNCKKPVRNTDIYCHRCGQKLMFPNIDFTPYVEGKKQELIVRWDDDNLCEKKLKE